VKTLTLLSISLFCLLFSFRVLANQTDQQNSWVQTDWYSNKYDKSEFKTYQKNNLVLKDVINATVSITKKSNEKKSVVLDLFQKSTRIPLKNWHKENIDGLEIHEGVSISDGALYRIAFNSKNNEFSTSSVKIRYLLPAYLEAHLIQVELLGGKKKLIKPKGSAFFNLFIQQAYAQNLKNLNIKITNDFTEPLTNALGGAKNALTESAGQIAGSINNTANAGNNVANSLNSINDSAKNLMSAKNIAKSAAIAGTVFGVTSSLASMATHFLSNVAMDGFRTLFYEAKGEFKPEERDRRLSIFESSMRIFKDGQKPFTDMTIKLSLMADALLDFAGGTTFEKVLEGLQTRLNDAKKRKTEAGLDCESCSAAANAEIKQIEDLAKSVSEKIGPMNKNQLNKTCSDLDDLFTSWVDTEFTLSNARRIVITDLQIYVGHIIESTGQNSSFQQKRKLTNSCKKDSEQNKENILRQLDGKSCDGANATTDICIKFWSAQGVIEDCEQMMSNTFSDGDATHLAESARDQVRTFRRFSKNISDQACDRKVQSCNGNTMRLIRTDVNDKLSKLSKVCTQTAFAEKFEEEKKRKESPQYLAEQTATKKCVQSSPGILSWLKNLFCSEKSASTGAYNSLNNQISY
jgi:hypothetical protein